MQHEMPQTKSEVLDRIRTAHAALEQMIGQMSDEQLTTPTADVGWSIKDHLAHITAWEQVLLRAHIGGSSYAEALAQDEPLPENTTVDDVNDWLYQQNKNIALASVRDAFAQSYQQVLAAIGQMSEAELLTGYSNVRTEAAMIEVIADNTWQHYDEHATTIQQLTAKGNKQQR